MLVVAQLTSGHCAFLKRPRGPAILEKGAANQRPVSGLIGHLLPTAREE
jgi:hypothetical protein